MASTVEIIGDPVEEIPNLIVLGSQIGAQQPESGRRPHDDLQQAAEAIGRTNVTYEHIWKAVKEANGKWVLVRCNSARRSLLLASSALQHRTQPHDVSRRGRIVCIRLMHDTVQKTA